jgi:hypothetical protein
VDTVAGCAVDGGGTRAGKTSDRNSRFLVEKGIAVDMNTQPKRQKHKVRMSLKKRKAKLLKIFELRAETLSLSVRPSANQLRFIEVAVTCGPELEPSGLLAGRRQ